MRLNKIMQICPADGWYVIYEVDGKEKKYPIAVWALYEAEAMDDEEGGGYYQEVIGLVHTQGFYTLMPVMDEEPGKFIGYVGPGEV